MSDYAHRRTDAEIRAIEKRLRKEYRKARDEVQEKIDDYFRRFQLKDAKWREWVDTGYKTPEEYLKWREGQIIVGDRWKSLRDSIAKDYANANKLARRIVREKSLDIYADTHNWSTYDIEKQLLIDTGYTLFNRDAIAFLLKNNPQLLPDPGADLTKDILNALEVRYNRQQLQSIMMQCLLQGMGLPEMSRRLATELGEKNYKAAIRNARTMMTYAENAGRLRSYERAENMGVNIKKTWVATLDGRTRHEHRLLDGQTVPVDKPFTVEGHEIMCPGDPTARPELVYNCRCTMISQLKGYEIDSKDLRPNDDIEGMTYDEWKKSHEERSNPLDLPERKQEAARMEYIREYRHGGRK